MGNSDSQVTFADFVSEKSLRTAKAPTESAAVLPFKGPGSTGEVLAQFRSESFLADQALEHQEALPVGQSTMDSWGRVTNHRPEILLGRVAAASVRPVKAWQLLPGSWRLLMLAGYAAVAYFIVLGALMVF